MMNSENPKVLTEIDHQRIETLINLFMLSTQKRSQQQHSELFNSMTALLTYLDEKELLIEMEIIKNGPVAFFIEQRPNWFTSEQIKRIDRSYSLPELDFLYFRDTSYPNKLKKEYKSSRRKSFRDNNKVYLSEIIIVLSFVREYLFNNLYTMAKKYNLQIKMIVLPQTSGMDPMEAVGIDRTNKTFR